MPQHGRDLQRHLPLQVPWWCPKTALWALKPPAASHRFFLLGGIGAVLVSSLGSVRAPQRLGPWWMPALDQACARAALSLDARRIPALTPGAARLSHGALAARFPDARSGAPAVSGGHREA